jgi:predicted metal-dependent hydrolase
MIHAFEQFNQGLYWHQHESLETIWRAETNLELKNFYKGVLQVGVGFHHLTRRNYRGVVKVLTRGIRYLVPFAPRCFGVDVDRLMKEASAVLARVNELGEERMDEIRIVDLPRVHWS